MNYYYKGTVGYVLSWYIDHLHQSLQRVIREDRIKNANQRLATCISLLNFILDDPSLTGIKLSVILSDEIKKKNSPKNRERLDMLKEAFNHYLQMEDQEAFSNLSSL